MIFFTKHDGDIEEEEAETDEIKDAEANIDDSVLDEIAEDDPAEEADETEGFGLISESEALPEKPAVHTDDEAEALDEDAEDVDFDTFDDVDEL